MHLMSKNTFIFSYDVMHITSFPRDSSALIGRTLTLCKFNVTGSETRIVDDSFQQFRIDFSFRRQLPLFVVHFDV